jgi:hypothetical protein
MLAVEKVQDFAGIVPFADSLFNNGLHAFCTHNIREYQTCGLICKVGSRLEPIPIPYRKVANEVVIIRMPV